MEYDSIDNILNTFLPENDLGEINRILYGNQKNPRFVSFIFIVWINNLELIINICSYLGSEKLPSYHVEKYSFKGTSEKERLNARMIKVSLI